jgi:hypothetical protein
LHLHARKANKVRNLNFKNHVKKASGCVIARKSVTRWETTSFSIIVQLQGDDEKLYELFLMSGTQTVAGFKCK